MTGQCGACRSPSGTLCDCQRSHSWVCASACGGLRPPRQSAWPWPSVQDHTQARRDAGLLTVHLFLKCKTQKPTVPVGLVICGIDDSYPSPHQRSLREDRRVRVERSFITCWLSAALMKRLDPLIPNVRIKSFAEQALALHKGAVRPGAG